MNESKRRKKWDEIEWIIVWSGILAACYLLIATKTTTTSNRLPPLTFYLFFRRYIYIYIYNSRKKKHKKDDRRRNASLFWSTNYVPNKNIIYKKIIFLKMNVYMNGQITLISHKRWTSCLSFIMHHQWKNNREKEGQSLFWLAVLLSIISVSFSFSRKIQPDERKKR
jgi:hypothetical protein